MKVAAWTAKIKEAFLNLPVLMKMISIAVGMTVVFGAVMAWQIHHAYYQLEKGEVDGEALFIANTLATGLAPMLRQNDLPAAQRLLDDMVRAWPPIHSVEVRDGQGRRLLGFGPVNARAPVFEQTAALASDVPGHVSVALNDNHIDFELTWHTQRLIATTVLISVLGIAATWLLMLLVTHPLVELTRAVQAVKAGNYRVRATVRARDEVGELAATFNEMIAALQQKDDLNHQLLRKIITTEEEERKRVAHELHHQTGQTLTSLIANLAALKSQEQPDRLTASLALASQTLGEVHDLSRALHPSVLEDIGLVPALRRLCDDLAKEHGLKVDIETVGLEEGSRLPSAVEAALYRMTQEAITLAARHRQARAIGILLHRRATSALAVLEDDGQAFETRDWRANALRGDRLGLLSIEERAVLLGGSLRIESKAGVGTSLFVEIPLADLPND